MPTNPVECVPNSQLPRSSWFDWLFPIDLTHTLKISHTPHSERIYTIKTQLSIMWNEKCMLADLTAPNNNEHTALQRNSIPAECERTRTNTKRGYSRWRPRRKPHRSHYDAEHSKGEYKKRMRRTHAEKNTHTHKPHAGDAANDAKDVEKTALRTQ